MANVNPDPYEHEPIPGDYMPRAISREIIEAGFPLVSPEEVEARQRMAKKADLSHEIDAEKVERDILAEYAGELPEEPGYVQGIVDTTNRRVEAQMELTELEQQSSPLDETK